MDQFSGSRPPAFDAWEFVVSGPESLIEHGHMYLIVPDAPKKLRKKINERGPLVLSPEEVNEFGLSDRFTQPIVNDLLLQNLYATQGFNYLSDREIDFDVVAAINDPATSDKSQSLFNGLSHAVPLVPQADLSALVKLRSNEGEAFRVYRDRLNSLLLELRSEPDLTEGRVRQALQDAIEPELNKIDQAVKENSRLLHGQLVTDMALSVGFVSIGLFSGILSPAVGQVFASLGGFKYLSSAVDKARQLVAGPREVRTNSCYFLWKASGGPNRMSIKPD